MTSVIPANWLTRAELRSLGSNVAGSPSIDPDDFDDAAIERSLSLHELFGIADPPRRFRRSWKRRRAISSD
jgi:hypothetical protein